MNPESDPNWLREWRDEYRERRARRSEWVYGFVIGGLVGLFLIAAVIISSNS